MRLLAHLFQLNYWPRSMLPFMRKAVKKKLLAIWRKVVLKVHSCGFSSEHAIDVGSGHYQAGEPAVVQGETSTARIGDSIGSKNELFVIAPPERGKAERTRMNPLCSSRVATEKEKQTAKGRDFAALFTEQWRDLYLLSFLLTKDHVEAWECFVDGFDDSVKGNPVIKQWAQSWARLMITENAIRSVAPRPNDSKEIGLTLDLEQSLVAEHSLDFSDPVITSVLELPVFERFVFVISILEGYPDQDCSALLRCSLEDTRNARGQALQRIAQSFTKIQGQIPKPFTEYTTQDLNTLVSTTLAGFLYISQRAVKQMVRQKSGSIVNVSTTLADQPIAGVDAAVQIMLKGALNAVTRALAIEYAKEGVRVNTIAPGVINTPMHKPETHDFLKGLHPVGRIGEVKEIVDAVLFLTDATFTTGEILHVNGGAHAGKW